MGPKKTGQIVIFVAMKSEAVSFLSRGDFHRPEFFTPLPSQLWRGGAWENLEVELLIPGIDPRHQVDRVGPVAAAMALVDYLGRRPHPDLLINAGTCGAFQHGPASRVGQVFCAQGPAVFFDQRISLPGFQEQAEGHFPLHRPSSFLQHSGLALARVATGGSLDFREDDGVRMRALGAELKEMELAAVAWAAESFSLPLVAFKAVTDMIDGPRPSGEQFLENLDAAQSSLGQLLWDYLGFLNEHWPDSAPTAPCGGG